MAPGMSSMGPIDYTAPRFRKFQAPTLYKDVDYVSVEIAGTQEDVMIDPQKGPIEFQVNHGTLIDGENSFPGMLTNVCVGGTGFTDMQYNITVGGDYACQKKWSGMTSTEQTILIHRTAKKNRLIRDKYPELATHFPKPEKKSLEPIEPVEESPKPTESVKKPSKSAKEPEKLAAPFYPDGYAPGNSDMPRFARPACEIVAPFRKNKIPPPYYLQKNKKKFGQNTMERNPGEVYGLTMPFTPEELFDDGGEYGCKWLTKAFHAAGSMPLTNSVKEFVFKRRFYGGHGGIKGLFKVKYAKDDPSLDEMLFIKMPYPFSENDAVRYRDEGMGFNGDKFGGEWLFYRYLAPHVPFPVPKLYFGDVSRKSTQAVCINAAVPFPSSDDTRPHSEFSPGECFPHCVKCEDYKLSNPDEYYFPIFKLMGTFAGLAKAKKMGPEQETLPWYDCTPQTDPCTAVFFPDVVEALTIFILHIAPHWFPDEAKGSWIAKFTEKSGPVCQHQSELANFLYNDPMYVGLHHENANIDNAYYFKRDDGTLDCGMLDWAATCHLSYATGIMGCTVACGWETLVNSQDALMKCWFDAYHATGAPKLNWHRMMLHYRVATLIGAYGIFSMARGQNHELIKLCQSWNDDKVAEFFGSKFQHGMIYSRVMLMVKQGDYFWDCLGEAIGK